MSAEGVGPFALAGGALVFFAAAAVLVFFVQSLFLLWGARIAGIEHRGFGRAMAVTILGGLASLAASLLLSLSGPVAPIVGLIAGFLCSALVAMPIFRTTFGRALGASVLAWALSLLVFGLLAVLLFGLGLSLAFFR